MAAKLRQESYQGLITLGLTALEDQAFEEGLRLIGQGRRAAAIQTMERAAAQWPGNDMFKMKLQAVRKGASKHHTDEAQRYLDSGDWRSAAAQRSRIRASTC